MDRRFLYYLIKTLGAWRFLLPRKIKKFIPRRVITLLLFLLLLWFLISKIDLSTILPSPALPKEESRANFFSNQSYSNLKSTYLQALNSAEKSILVLIYSLRDHAIINVLNKQAKKGINVTVICDAEASQDVSNQLNSNVKVHYQSGVGIMHLKLLVIDSDQVYIGSANLTGKSLGSHGNLVVGLSSPVMANAIQQLADSMVNPSIKAPASVSVQLPQQQIELWFLPSSGKTAYHRLMNLLYGAKSSLRIAMYTLTHPQLIEAIVDARDRGVNVEVVLDRTQAQDQGNVGYRKLMDAGIKVGLSTSDDLLHYKMAWIDESILVNGSANWTISAFNRNNECFLVINPLDAKQNEVIKGLWQTIFSNATFKPAKVLQPAYR